MFRVVTLLPLEHTLCDRGDRRVMPPLDGLEHLCEARVVVVQLGRELDFWGFGVISKFRVSICVSHER